MQQLTIHKGTAGIPVGFTQTENISGATVTIYYKKPDATEGSWSASVQNNTDVLHTLVEADIDQESTKDDNWLMWGKVVQGSKIRWLGPVELYVIDVPEAA